MDKNDFEGTLVLEKLARVGALEDFMAAADSVNLEKAAELMRSAGVDEETITIVLEKMQDPFDEH